MKVRWKIKKSQSLVVIINNKQIDYQNKNVLANIG